MEISGMNELKENFMNQMREIDEKISQIQAELTKAQEYKIKLQGGLETLELLEKNPPNVFKQPEEVEDDENIAPGNGEGFEEE
jgi:hypothetical protein